MHSRKALSQCKLFVICRLDSRFTDDRRFNNSDKGAVAHAVVHRALWEYLSALAELEDAAEQEKFRREMFETYVLHCPFLPSRTDLPQVPGRPRGDGAHEGRQQSRPRVHRSGHREGHPSHLISELQHY